MAQYEKHFSPANDRKLHDRQPGEPSVAWKAFIIYRDLGFQRTIPKAVRAYRQIAGHSESKEATTRRNFERYSIRWGWVRRAESWDIELDKHRKRLAIEEVRRMKERHIAIAQTMQKVGKIELDKILKNAEKKIEEGVLNATDVRYLIEVGMKIERQNHGEPDSIVEKRENIGADSVREQLRNLFDDEEARETVRALARKLMSKV